MRAELTTDASRRRGSELTPGALFGHRIDLSFRPYRLGNYIINLILAVFPCLRVCACVRVSRDIYLLESHQNLENPNPLWAYARCRRRQLFSLMSTPTLGTWNCASSSGSSVRVLWFAAWATTQTHTINTSTDVEPPPSPSSFTTCHSD